MNQVDSGNIKTISTHCILINIPIYLFSIDSLPLLHSLSVIFTAPINPLLATITNLIKRKTEMIVIVQIAKKRLSKVVSIILELRVKNKKIT